MSTIAIIATLDTKGEEASYLRDRIQALGHTPMLIDSGMWKEPTVQPDVDRSKLFEKVGIMDHKAFFAENGKPETQKKLREGLNILLAEYCAEGKISGVIGIGGGQGSAMATASMQSLPIGFPKVMISTVACGTAKFGDYVGSKDIVMIPSIVDICGINSVTKVVFNEGCAAVTGMAQSYDENKAAEGDKPIVALTMAGVTTPCVMKVREALEAQGYETIVCHTNVIGIKTVDEMARQGRIKACLDITPHEWGGYLLGGLMACDATRMEYIYESDIPLITLPGAIDFSLRGPVDEMDEKYKALPHYCHTPFHTHVANSPEEMREVGAFLANKHNGHKGKNVIIVPTEGFSMRNREGELLYNAEANAAFLESVKATVKDESMVKSIDCHINDAACAELIVEEFNRLMK